MSPMCKRLSSLAPVFLHTGLARLAVVVVEVLQPGDQPEPAEVDLVRARVVADVIRLSRAVGKEGQARLARPEPVREPGPGRARNHVAGTDRMLLVDAALAHALRARVQLEYALAVEHDEELLVRGMAVRRRAFAAGGEVAPVEPGPLGAGLPCEPLPAPFRLRAAVDVVDVDDAC